MANKVRRTLGFDPKRNGAQDPILKPQERFGIPDQTLFGHLEKEASLAFTTLEGEVVRGKLEWIGRWELGLHLSNGNRAVVFRHAIANLQAG